MSSLFRRTGHLYHYTTADVGVFNILRDGKLRLSPYESTNDPAENKQRFPSLSAHADDVALTGPGQNMVSQIWAELDLWLRRYVKLACFTEDFIAEDALEPDLLAGWNHPSMWTHYAAGHSGMCLQFDRDRLVQSFHRQFAFETLRFVGQVRYVAEHFSAVPFESLNVGQIAHFGLDAVAAHYIDAHQQDLFFTKHSDWAAEREFRLVTGGVSLLPQYIEIGDALECVVVGQSFPAGRRGALVEAVGALSGIELRQVISHNGHLTLAPFPELPPPPSVVGRVSGPVRDRLVALRSAEKSRQRALEAGKNATENLAPRLEAAVRTNLLDMEAWTDVEARFYESVTAVPVP